MGFEIAKAAANLGAEVILVSGPTHQTINHSLVRVKPITSAEEMYIEVRKHFESTDIAILSAAVADYRPKTVATQKIKKKDILSSEDKQQKKMLSV